MNPRLLDLWEIMNRFDAEALILLLHEMAQVEVGCFMQKISGGGTLRPGELVSAKARQCIGLSKIFFKSQSMVRGFEDIMKAEEQLKRPLMDASSVCEIFHRLQQDVLADLKSNLFLRIAEGRQKRDL